MMRRRDRPDKESTVINRIKKEHSLFKYGKLSGSNREIYESCNQIRVYECLYEYFLYQDQLNSEFIEVAYHEEYILQNLYDLYLKDEMLKVGTWEEIEELLDIYVVRQEGK